MLIDSKASNTVFVKCNNRLDWRRSWSRNTAAVQTFNKSLQTRREIRDKVSGTVGGREQADRNYKVHNEDSTAAQ